MYITGKFPVLSSIQWRTWAPLGLRYLAPLDSVLPIPPEREGVESPLLPNTVSPKVRFRERSRPIATRAAVIV